MPSGVILLIILLILTMFGWGRLIAEKLELPLWIIVIFLLAMLLLNMIPNTQLSNSFYVNWGGGVLPIIFALFLMLRKSSLTEGLTVFLSNILCAAGIFLLSRALATVFSKQALESGPYCGICFALLALLIGGLNARITIVTLLVAPQLLQVIRSIESTLGGPWTPVSLGIGAGFEEAAYALFAGGVLLNSFLFFRIINNKRKIRREQEKKSPAV